MNEKEKQKTGTDMEGVRLVAKGLLSTEIYDTEYAPFIISHPFANSGIAFLPGKNGLEMLDITSSEENHMRWRKYLDKCIKKLEIKDDAFEKTSTMKLKLYAELQKDCGEGNPEGKA